MNVHQQPLPTRADQLPIVDSIQDIEVFGLKEGRVHRLRQGGFQSYVSDETARRVEAGVAPFLDLIAGKPNADELAAVATSGSYGDLEGKPTLGTAAGSDVEDFATAAQGARADNAVTHQESEFATRSAFIVAELSDLPIASVVSAAGLMYVRVEGATAILDKPGWEPFGPITPEHFGAPFVLGNDEVAINAALAFAGAKNRKTVYSLSALYQVYDTVRVGDGKPGVASTYENIKLIGQGQGALNSPHSSTMIKWTGPAAGLSAVIEVAGRITGPVIHDIYIDGNNLAGYGLRILSSYRGSFKRIHGANWVHRGLVLTIQGAPLNNAWYSARNEFDDVEFAGKNDNNLTVEQKAWWISGTVVGGVRNGVWGNTFRRCHGAVARTLTPDIVPGALHLGYADSNVFDKSDFGLYSSPLLPEQVFKIDVAGLQATNGAGLTDGDTVRLRCGLVGVSANSLGNRWGTLYKYDASSTATADGHYVVQPADGIGRFLRYRGGSITIDASVDPLFPVANVFKHSSIGRCEPIVVVATGGNTAGRSEDPYPTPACLFWPWPSLDYSDLPLHIPNMAGMTDGGQVFGFPAFDIRGKDLVLSQQDRLRRVRFRQNSGNGGTNNGAYISHENRASDSDAWTESARLLLPTAGGLTPNIDGTQLLGNNSLRWERVTTLAVGYAGGVIDTAGFGSPEGVVTASSGSTYRNKSGGAGTTFYVKESGTGNTGWVAK